MMPQSRSTFLALWGIFSSICILLVIPKKVVFTMGFYIIEDFADYFDNNEDKFLSLYHKNCTNGFLNKSKMWQGILKNDLREKTTFSEIEINSFVTSDFSNQFFNKYLKQMYIYYFEMGFAKNQPFEQSVLDRLKPLIDKTGDEMFNFMINNISNEMFKKIIGPLAKYFFTNAWEDGQEFAEKVTQEKGSIQNHKTSDTDIELYFNSIMREERFVEKVKIVKGNHEQLIKSLRRIYFYSYHYGKSYSGGEKVNFSQISADKRKMLSDLSKDFNCPLEDLGQTVFKAGFDKASHNIEPIDDPKFIQPPYYLYQLDDKNYKFYSLLDPSVNPMDVFNQFLKYSFRNDLKALNEQKSIIRLTGDIHNRAAFQKVIEDQFWASRFISKYLFRAYFQFLYISYFHSSFSQSDMDALAALEKYKITFNDLEHELKSMGYPKDIIDFHIKFTQELAGKAKDLSYDSTCELMDILFKNNKYREDGEAGILRLEMFISANIFGS